MKKLLLAGVAALLMATSAAHAFPSYKKCGEVFVRARIGGHSGADGNRYWTWEWYFEKKPVPSRSWLELMVGWSPG
jgi:hypothetical protein